jgi:voltage-gated potassium channel
MNHDSSKPASGGETELRPYELFMLLLCGYSLLTLALETFKLLPPDDVAILDAVDNVVCGIFLLDFLIQFGKAPNKLRFLSWGWIDLVSSIPVIDVFRAGRIIRVIRILRVLRGIRLARILAKYLQNNRADGTILAVIFVSILMLVLSSVAILQVEQQADGANIETPSDALWWATSTMTTVGYGDKYPVTTVGRVIAGFLMIGGVGLFGMLSGSVTSWILNPVEVRQEVDLDAIQIELESIHRRLDEVASGQRTISDPQLRHIVESWPMLSAAARHELAQLLDLDTKSVEIPRPRSVA